MASTSSDEIRVGVFVCACGLNIAGTVDIEDVAEHSRGLPDVAYVETNRYTCSDSGQVALQKALSEHNLNRVVVASCSPRLHGETFKKTCADVGVNPYLFEMANIREHCSWVHLHEPEAATEKAKELVEMAVVKAKLLTPQESPVVPVRKSTLVIGGGVAGIQASLDLADAGFHVFLVEKTPTIGGIMARLDKTFPTMDCSICILGPKMSDVGNHPNIDLISYADIEEISGFIGDYTVKVRQHPRYVTEECTACTECEPVCPVEVLNETDEGLNWRKAIYMPFPQSVPAVYTIDTDNCLGLNPIICGKCKDACREKGADCINYNDREKNREFNVGTIIIATGFKPFDPAKIPEYGWGRYPNVVSTLEFERIINAAGPTEGDIIRPGDMTLPLSVAFIQCVGSRDVRFHEYCSNFCCLETIKNALLIKEHHPEVDITVFYMDIRAFGKGFEQLYHRARMEGVKFIRARPSEIQEDPLTGNLRVLIEDPETQGLISPEFNMVILSIGAEPPDLSGVPIPLSRDAEGFLLEAHPKLKPVDTPSDGIFIAGGVESPKDIKECVTQASAASGRAMRLMAKGEYVIEPIFAEVDIETCNGCAICTSRCPYGAITVAEKRKTPASVTTALCKGCGTCAGDCPRDSITMRHFTDAQISAQIQAALKKNPEEKILAFCCNWCSYAGSDLAGVSRMQYPTIVRIVRTMCSGRVDIDFVKEAFELGAGAVLLTGCHPADCHYITGNDYALKRESKIRRWMKKQGIAQDRFKIEWVSAGEGKKFQTLIRDTAEIVERVNHKAQEPAKVTP